MKFSNHLRQLNSVNLKSQPHSGLSSFRAVTQAPINNDRVTIDGWRFYWNFPNLLTDEKASKSTSARSDSLREKFASIRDQSSRDPKSCVCRWIFYRWKDKYKENPITYAKQENIFIGKYCPIRMGGRFA